MTEFYEDDEPAEKIAEIFDSGEKMFTRRVVGWYCRHWSFTFGGSRTRVLVANHGCEMTPIYA